MLERLRGDVDMFEIIKNPIDLQWRRRDFFSGGGVLPGHLKAISRPAGGPGAAALRTVAKFHFLKRFKVLENESIFQKYQHFILPKHPFFLRKISKIEHILQEFLSFSKNYL